MGKLITNVAIELNLLSRGTPLILLKDLLVIVSNTESKYNAKFDKFSTKTAK